LYEKKDLFNEILNSFDKEASSIASSLIDKINMIEINPFVEIIDTNV
jgi:hypothetical protein